MNIKEEILKKIVSEKILLKNQENYYKLVTKSYEDAPDYEPSALKYWVALNKSNHDWFNRINSEVNFLFIKAYF
jgi:hypothetical protein